MPNSEFRTSSYDLPRFPPYTDSTLTILSHDLLSLVIPSRIEGTTTGWLPRMTLNDDESLGIWLYPFSTNFSPLHDHRIQSDPRICEDDIIARRTNAGKEDAKEMYMNLKGEKKMCQGREKKYCGVCYPSCRGKDYHWRDHFRLPRGEGAGAAKVECDEIKGLTISSSSPSPSAFPAHNDYSSPNESPETPSSSSSPTWIIPNILSFDSSALSKTPESWHLLHFRIQLNPDRPLLSDLEFIALESLWVQEPRAVIVIITSSTHRTTSKEQEEKIQRYRQMGYNLHVVEVGKEEMREREWWAGENSRAWVENWDKWERMGSSTL